MRIVLVHNPSAGEGHPSRAELLDIFRAGQLDPTYQSVSEDGWESVLRDGTDFDAVVVAGGDGTIRKVVHETYGRGIPIAIIPLGTANNMARALGADADPAAVISVLKEGRRVHLDLGRVDGLLDERLFMEGLGVGLLADTMQAVDRIKHEGQHAVRDEKRAALEMLLLQAREGDAVDLALTIDDTDCSGRYVLVQVMNIGCAGSNILLAPDADPSDGIFDVVMIPEQERGTAVRYVEVLLDDATVRPTFPVHRARDVVMEWSGSSLHVDDRLWPPSGACPPGSRLHVRVDDARAPFLVATGH